MVVRYDRLRADLATRRSRLKWVGIWTIATALGWSMPATAVVAGFSGHEDGDVAFGTLAVASSLTGVSVGVGQWLVLRRWMPAASRWIVATALGWLVAFPVGLVVGFVAGLAVFATIGVMIGGIIGMVQGESWSYVGAFTALIGPATGLAIAGTVVGLSQSLILRRWAVHAYQWILITAVGGTFVSPGGNLCACCDRLRLPNRRRATAGCSQLSAGGEGGEDGVPG